MSNQLSANKVPWTTKERLALLSLSFAVILIHSIPYTYGALICPSEKVYTGLIGPYGNDQAFYLGWGAAQAREGEILFEDKYNGRVDRRLVFHPLWLLMGFSAKITGLSVSQIFYFERIICSLILVFVLYHLLSMVFIDVFWRFLALVLLLFSGDCGHIYSFVFSDTSPVVWVVESNIFLTALWELNLPLAYVLFVIALIQCIRVFFFADEKYIWRAGFITLLLGMIYPYALISIYFISLCLILSKLYLDNVTFSRQLFKNYILLGLISSPILLWDFYLTISRPELLVGQAYYHSPAIYKYLLAFGLLTLLAILGSIHILRKRQYKHYYLLVWLIATFIQMYFPLSFQLQLVLGIQIPLIILTVIFLQNHINIDTTLRKCFIILSLLILTVGNNWSEYNRLFTKQTNSTVAYIDQEIYQAMLMLKNVSSSDTVVIAPFTIAPLIPVYSHNRMYSGDYKAPTANFEVKKQYINWLFDHTRNKTISEIRQFMLDNHIDYIFSYRQENPAFLPSNQRLQLIYDGQKVAIYHLVK